MEGKGKERVQGNKVYGMEETKKWIEGKNKRGRKEREKDKKVYEVDGRIKYGVKGGKNGGKEVKGVERNKK